MRITTDDEVAGRPARQVRDALRYCRSDQGFTTEQLARHLGVSDAEGHRMAAALVAEGFVEAWTQDHRDWRTTTAGNALSMATAAKPVSRATAQRALDAFLVRVAEVNGSPAYLWRVDRVVLFGSFLDPERDPVGDVDLAISLSMKNQDSDTRMAEVREHTRAAMAGGRHLPTFISQLLWPKNEVLLYLKSRSRVLSLIDDDDDILNQTTCHTLYERMAS